MPTHADTITAIIKLLGTTATDHATDNATASIIEVAITELESLRAQLAERDAASPEIANVNMLLNERDELLDRLQRSQARTEDAKRERDDAKRERDDARSDVLERGVIISRLRARPADAVERHVHNSLRATIEWQRTGLQQRNATIEHLEQQLAEIKDAVEKRIAGVCDARDAALAELATLKSAMNNLSCAVIRDDSSAARILSISHVTAALEAAK